MPINWDLIRIIAGIISLIIFIFALKQYYPQLLSKLCFILRAKYIKLPFRKSPMVMKIIKKEETDSAKRKYETFDAFLKDCPKYQITSGSLDVIIRNIYRSVGVKFQQYVFIDKSNSIDKTAWLRREGHVVLHEGGTYALPWDSEKEIVYFDINEFRPLIDKTKEMDWRNPDMCADVITGLVNENTMKGYREPVKDANNYVLGLCALIVILIVVDIYTGDTSNKNTMNILTQIMDQTGRIP